MKAFSPLGTCVLPFHGNELLTTLSKNTTSFWRWYNVVWTSKKRCINVETTSCAHWASVYQVTCTICDSTGWLLNKFIFTDTLRRNPSKRSSSTTAIYAGRRILQQTHHVSKSLEWKFAASNVFRRILITFPFLLEAVVWRNTTKRGSRHAAHSVQELRWRIEQLLKYLIKKRILS